MSKGRPQLPRIQPVGRATRNPPHPHRDGDLAYIMENWPQIASAAWAGYLAQGRGRTIVDTRKTYPVPTGLGHAISYLPAGMVTAADDARMVREYDPEREVVVGMLRANGDEDVYRLGASRLTPKQAYEQTPKQ
jgi:hypothetical protein